MEITIDVERTVQRDLDDLPQASDVEADRSDEGEKHEADAADAKRADYSKSGPLER